jgi:hypothetical protein
MPMIEQLVALIAIARDPLCYDREPLDVATRQLTAAAAKLLRSTSPNDGQIEILLHEMARTLEKVSGLGPDASSEARAKSLPRRIGAPVWRFCRERTRAAARPEGASSR